MIGNYRIVYVMQSFIVDRSTNYSPYYLCRKILQV